MQLAAMPHTTSLADLPLEIVRRILAAAVHGMRMEHLNIVARNDDKNWPSLLLYLNLRGVCSGYVLCTCLHVMFDHCMQWRCCRRMPAFCSTLMKSAVDRHFVLQMAQLAQVTAAACGKRVCDVSSGCVEFGPSTTANQPTAFVDQP